MEISYSKNISIFPYVCNFMSNPPFITFVKQAFLVVLIEITFILFFFRLAVDEQNLQTSQAIAQCAAAVRTSNVSSKVSPSLAHILDDLPETIIDADEKDDMIEEAEEKHDEGKEKGSLESENGKLPAEENLPISEKDSMDKERESSCSPSNANVSSQDEVDVMMEKAIAKLKLDSNKSNEKSIYSGW